jgi:hypothetical protein
MEMSHAGLNRAKLQAAELRKGILLLLLLPSECEMAGRLLHKMEFKQKKHGEGPSVDCGVEILRIPTREPDSQDKYE